MLYTLRSMTKDDIISLPNSHLRQRSQKIGLIDDNVRQLVADMESATIDWEMSRKHEIGVALAAVQIDRLYRVVVIRNNFEDKNDQTFSAFINPVITKFEGELIEDFEGCLSVPNVYGKVPRYSKVKVKALNLNGQEVRLSATGFLARVFQHEIDHTHGTVFVDHIKDNPNAFYTLTSSGELEKIDYEKDIRNSSILW